MRNLRTEEEIIANWKGGLEAPVVSICCITFNHELYIEDTLEGFLIQETDFPFEILIHDDASTDHTAEIIREYEARYPRIIKPIYQAKNQYSKGIKVNSVYNFSRAKGGYIALCEGDDYWVSKDKLYTQIMLMKQHPDINISFHPAYQVDGFVLNKDNVLCNYGDEVKICSPEEVILGGGGFMPTASLIVKTNILQNLPEWFSKHAPVGDMYIQMIASLRGGAIFFPQKSGVYRTNIPGSWSTMQKKIACKKLEVYSNNHVICFSALGSENALYKSVIDIALAQELVICSWSAMINGCPKLARELVEKSMVYSGSEYLDLKQSLLMKFKWDLRLLSVLVRFKNTLKNLIS